jgi:hypothetical protein
MRRDDRSSSEAAILRDASDAFVGVSPVLGVRAIYVRRVSTRESGPGQ